MCVDIDPALCSEHGWLNRDFLGVSREDIFGKGPASPAMADVIVVTNPPFVANVLTKKIDLIWKWTHDGNTSCNSLHVLGEGIPKY